VLRAVVADGSEGPQVLLTAEGGEEGYSEYTFADCAIIPDGESPGTKIESLEACDEGPSPIMPEAKEFFWGSGAFVVFALLMRFFLYPRLRRSMDARDASIREAHESAEAERDAARGEVSSYETALAEVRAEVAARIDAARSTVEQERTARLSEVNDAIAARRATASAEVDAAHGAARPQVGTAVATVASRAVELATGRAPDPNAVSRVVDELMNTGVSQ